MSSVGMNDEEDLREPGASWLLLQELMCMCHGT